MADLNSRQLAFAREYAACNVGTKAAKAAGYAPKAAYAQASRSLRNAKIQAEIQRLRGLHATRLDVTVASVTQKLLDDHELAHQEGQAGAAVSASNALAKLHGLGSK